MIPIMADRGREAGFPELLPDETARVLVVDDDRDIAESCAVLLQLAGFEAMTACKGRDALQLACEFHPHVVLLDIGLPDLSGYDVARRLKADLTLPTITLVAITAYASEEHRRQARAAGFDHYLVKPVTFSHLLSLPGFPCPRPDEASHSPFLGGWRH
jgi:DNA-binding response OmpR family regulator